MSTRKHPTIVFVDDNTEELGPLSKLVQVDGRASSKVLSPADVDLDELVKADLVVVDYTLDDWIDNVSIPEDQISLRPLNGVALAAVLREHAAKQKEYPPTGFALITGRPEAFATLPAEHRPHVISRLSNVEWLFAKQADQGSTANQIVSLASAIRSLPKSVGDKLRTMDGLLTYLGVRKGRLHERYRDAVERCRPPIHLLAQRSHGLAILRWLLHRILPHTAFLFDTFHLAARLSVSPDSLEHELAKKDSPTSSLLSQYLYGGPLSDFDGKRWWRDGIEQLLWDITRGNSANVEAVRSALDIRECTELEAIDIIRPVATLDSALNREDKLSSRDDAVKLQLDDWPGYAEPPYARRETINEHLEMKMYIADSGSN